MHEMETDEIKYTIKTEVRFFLNEHLWLDEVNKSRNWEILALLSLPFDLLRSAPIMPLGHSLKSF